MAVNAPKASLADRRQRWAESLIEARLARGVTQEQLAESLGLSQPAVAGWEKGGKVPEHDIVFEIERVLKLDPGWLSQHLGYMPPEQTKTTTTMRDAVEADPYLDDNEKRVVLDMYFKLTRGRRS